MNRTCHAILLFSLALVLPGCAEPVNELTAIGARWVRHSDGELREVNLRNTAAEDYHVRMLSSMRQVWMVNLDNTNITDESLIYLGEMSQLKGLNLANTAVTDSGLSHLVELRKLQGLVLDNTYVSAAGVRQLRAAMPHTNIMHGANARQQAADLTWDLE